MTKKEFLEEFRLLEVNYIKTIKNEIKDVWFDEFKDMTKENFHKCIINCIKAEKTFPTINKVNDINDIWLV